MDPIEKIDVGVRNVSAIEGSQRPQKGPLPAVHRAALAIGAHGGHQDQLESPPGRRPFEIHPAIASPPCLRRRPVLFDGLFFSLALVRGRIDASGHTLVMDPSGRSAGSEPAGLGTPAAEPVGEPYRGMAVGHEDDPGLQEVQVGPGVPVEVTHPVPDEAPGAVEGHSLGDRIRQAPVMVARAHLHPLHGFHKLPEDRG